MSKRSNLPMSKATQRELRRWEAVHKAAETQTFVCKIAGVSMPFKQAVRQVLRDLEGKGGQS